MPKDHHLVVKPPSAIQTPVVNPFRAREAEERKARVAKLLTSARSLIARLLFLCDATGSMSRIWSGASRDDIASCTREQIKQGLSQARALGGFQMRWVAYRDHDAESRLAGGLIQASQWTDQFEQIREFIDSIICGGGGNTRPEAVADALRFAADDEAVSRIVLIGDAPPHAESDWRVQTQRLKTLGRPVDTLLVESYPDPDLELARTIFQQISAATGGQHAVLRSAEDLYHILKIVVAKTLSPDRPLLTGPEYAQLPEHLRPLLGPPR